MPVADCCCTVRADRSTLSHVSVTCSSSPEVSSIAFHAQPPDLPPVPLMELGFAVICPLARHRRPQIQFLSIGSRVCSTLLSDIASRRHLCASLSLHLHQVVKRTFTSKRLNMLGTHKKAPRHNREAFIPHCTGIVRKAVNSAPRQQPWPSSRHILENAVSFPRAPRLPRAAPGPTGGQRDR